MLKKLRGLRWPRGARRAVPFREMILLSAAVGAGGGVLASAYYYVLQGALWVVWEGLAKVVGPVWLVTGTGGVLVGLALKRMGVPGEISAVVDNIHLERGRIDARQTPSMVVVSLLSIAFGGSAGPEAPLVQVLGSAGSWLGDRLRLYGQFVRTLTFCGMATALGAFFGAPLGGALFALEIPHRRGLEYYEALIPALVSATVGFVVFRLIAGGEAVLYRFAAVPEVSIATVGQGAALGVLGAGTGTLFVVLFRWMERVAERFHGHPVLLAAAGGAAIGLLAEVLPDDLPVTTLFWGEFQIRELIAGGGALLQRDGWAVAAGFLVLLALAKMVAIGLTLHSGFRGGFIFPLFFIGASLGLAVSFASQGAVLPATAALCLMAAVNVAVTKTPVSSTVILATVSGTSLIPVIGTASLVSFLLTTRVTLIRTQRSRAPFHASGLSANG